MLCPEELVTLATAIGVALAKGRTPEELNLMAGVLGQISSTLANISLQRLRIENCLARTAPSTATAAEESEEALDDFLHLF